MVLRLTSHRFFERKNQNIFVDGKWVKLKDYADSPNIHNMTPYSVDREKYFMQNIEKVQVIVPGE